MYQKDQGPGTRDAVGVCVWEKKRECVDAEVDEDVKKEEEEEEEEEEGPVRLALRVKNGAFAAQRRR
jgi:hypothetical protein